MHSHISADLLERGKEHEQEFNLKEAGGNERDEVLQTTYSELNDLYKNEHLSRHESSGICLAYPYIPMPQVPHMRQGYSLCPRASTLCLCLSLYVIYMTINA